MRSTPFVRSCIRSTPFCWFLGYITVLVRSFHGFVRLLALFVRSLPYSVRSLNALDHFMAQFGRFDIIFQIMVPFVRLRFSFI